MGATLVPPFKINLEYDQMELTQIDERFWGEFALFLGAKRLRSLLESCSLTKPSVYENMAKRKMHYCDLLIKSHPRHLSYPRRYAIEAA